MKGWTVISTQTKSQRKRELLCKTEKIPNGTLEPQSQRNHYIENKFFKWELVREQYRFRKDGRDQPKYLQFLMPEFPLTSSSSERGKGEPWINTH